MSQHTAYMVEDFRDLPFDVSMHAEALRSFTALNLAPCSIRPALRARDLVFIRVPSCRFRIGVTEDAAAQEDIDRGNGCIAYEMICRADNTTDAEQIRSEVEQYFLRHYPGRTLARGQENREAGSGRCVYIVCYRPSD